MSQPLERANPVLTAELNTSPVEKLNRLIGYLPRHSREYIHNIIYIRSTYKHIYVLHMTYHLPKTAML